MNFEADIANPDIETMIYERNEYGQSKNLAEKGDDTNEYENDRKDLKFLAAEKRRLAGLRYGKRFVFEKLYI